MPIIRENYPEDWELRSQFIRFYRARNKCEFCGAENYMPHPQTGSKVILTVAHLDHNTQNNSFFNLAALCQKCHNNYDQTKRIANRRAKRTRFQIKLFSET